ncbi:hypothetical protein TMEN_7436 [Trichophyton mentagrophytes]|uniref:RPEL repeat n=3 Tax=Trichophyton TaxID=5550 RepID=A0A9P4YHS1_9EURO|nr:hypothetical protein TEQG_07765 [Trichophyton equinum CBS 127.97]EZF34386.1 hypothetical protein H101_02074 [Trichophyton interdigitale H6]KAF3895616.1 RPEL repeat [Trichophyton interdigitale]KDB25839.1 hypothetical protein H109_02349 [Trichophyton interdigitale MR816]GBF64720.1 hypothetical protein TMEN_7436 [Trichophyton mentagrophytes]
MSDAPTNSTVEVPTSPISERRDSLAKSLQCRPDAQDLKNRHILLDTKVAPSLQAAQQELARQQAADSLKRGLEKRADRDTLVERNILPASNAAPALQGPARELEKHMRADSLEQKILHRPSPEELVKAGVLTEEENPVKV